MSLLTRQQLSKELQLDSRKIKQLETEGLPVIDLGRKTKRYNLNAVYQWIEEQSGLAQSK